MLVSTLTELFMRANIFVDPSNEIDFGWDRDYVDRLITFPTVGLDIWGGEGLDGIVRIMRIEEGHGPVPDNASFDYHVGLNAFTKSRVDTVILATVRENQAPYIEREYIITLSEAEQAALYRQLDEQCREILGKSCEDLLAEARKRMEAELF